jgi:hypothetical protein
VLQSAAETVSTAEELDNNCAILAGDEYRLHVKMNDGRLGSVNCDFEEFLRDERLLPRDTT